MFPSTSSRETLTLSGKQNSLFPSGSHIKCIMFIFINLYRLVESDELTSEIIINNVTCDTFISARSPFKNTILHILKVKVK